MDKTADLAFIIQAWVSNLVTAMIPEKERVGGNYYLRNFIFTGSLLHILDVRPSGFDTAVPSLPAV